MTTKDGNLNDGRAVYYQGKRIEDFTAEPVFARTLKYIQRYYALLRVAKRKSRAYV